MKRSRIEKCFLLLLLTAALGTAAPSLEAQESPLDEEESPADDSSGYSKVTAKGVGVIGGIAAGAEVVLVVESIIRVKPLWPYIVLPIAGAVGGGIGGYKLEKHSRGGAIALLITSMVGIIPTVMATSYARSFHPEDVGAQKGGDVLPTVDYSEESFYDDSNETNGVVEIEARPEGISDAPVGPPSPSAADGQPDSAGYNPAYELDIESDGAGPPNVDSSETDSSDTAPNDVAPDATAPESAAPESAAPESRQYDERYDDRDERLAHLASGALLHMNRHFRFGLGIPAIDVVPVQLPQPWAGQTGIAFHIPLIALDLP